jgi:uncharacterized protein YjiS (DUF1127 family)
MPGGIYVDAPCDAGRSQGGFAATIVAVASTLRSKLAIWRERAHYRRTLAQMGERELADIGVSWPQIADEINRPFWRA